MHIKNRIKIIIFDVKSVHPFLYIRVIGGKSSFHRFSKWNCEIWERERETIFRFIDEKGYFGKAGVKLQGKFTLTTSLAWPFPDACFRMMACFGPGNSYPRRRMSGVFAQAWISLESKQQFHSGLHGLIFWALIVAGTHAPTCGWHETCK